MYDRLDAEREEGHTVAKATKGSATVSKTPAKGGGQNVVVTGPRVGSKVCAVTRSSSASISRIITAHSAALKRLAKK
jgi:hypothetical protein